MAALEEFEGFVRERIALGWTHQQLCDHFQSQYPGDIRLKHAITLLKHLLFEFFQLL